MLATLFGDFKQVILCNKSRLSAFIFTQWEGGGKGVGS